MVDGREIVLSPSQIETWATCKRKWAWRYIADIKAKQHPSAQVGTRVHSILEEYLRDGKAPDRMESMNVGGRIYAPGQVALSMLKHLPPAGSVQRVEEHFKIQIGGIWFQGYIDAQEPGKNYDHKTTADLRYAKSESDLRKDPQSLIYACKKWIENDTLSDTDDSDIVENQWTYGQTKGRNASRAVKVRLSGSEIEDGLEKYVLPIAREIAQAYADRPDPKSLAPTIKSCDLYGGCPNRDNCAISGKERLVSIMNRQEILEKLRAKKALKEGKETEAPAPEAPPTPAPVTEPEAPKVSALSKLKSKPKAGQINPEGEAQAAKPTPAPEPKAPEPEPKAQAPEAPKPVQAAEKTFVLFVDCEPLRHPRVIYLHDLVAPACATVAEEAGLEHWSLADFGKGPGLLAAQLRENLNAAPLPEKSAVVMSLHTPEGRATFQVLSEHAAMVVVSR